ncbi:hypothetical protein IAR55_000363 [Kwoniella newhampshirensis]|uniref:Uncharacterized protein n=1 Tax=Kwoniella newhampshirensis TaxID=1651941 RepID=A0AAW0Z6J8_9TREE
MDEHPQSVVPMGPLRGSPQHIDESTDWEKRRKRVGASSTSRGKAKAEVDSEAEEEEEEKKKKKGKFPSGMITKRKGPAPVAISDAAYGFPPAAVRKSSAQSEVTIVKSERLRSSSYRFVLQASPTHAHEDGEGPGGSDGEEMSQSYQSENGGDLGGEWVKKTAQLTKGTDGYPTRAREGIVHLFLGNDTAHVVTTAQANQLALSLRLNEAAGNAETSLLGKWTSTGEADDDQLLFQADKSTACLLSRTICLRLEDAFVGDTSAARLTCRLLHDALLLQRRKIPRTMPEIHDDLQQITLLRVRAIETARNVPEELKLQMVFDASKAVFEAYYGSQGPPGTNAYLVMQTRQILLSQWSMFTPVPPQNSAHDDQTEDLACELLNGLNSPIRWPSPHGDDQQPAWSQLKGFLSVLSVIERMYTFGKVISAE